MPVSSSDGPWSDGASCPVADTLARLSGKWKPMILHLLLEGETSFLVLTRLLPGASRKMVVAHLRELETDGLVARRLAGDARGRVLYGLTPRSRGLALILDDLHRWATATPGQSLAKPFAPSPQSRL